MTPNPTSAGSDRLDVAAKPPEPIQNWLLIFARGFTRPTGTSARSPTFTTPSNPFASSGLSCDAACSFRDSIRAVSVVHPRYPSTDPPSLIHSLGFADGL